MRKLLVFLMVLLSLLNSFFHPEIHGECDSIRSNFIAGILSGEMGLFKTVPGGTTAEKLLAQVNYPTENTAVFADCEYNGSFKGEETHIMRTVFLAVNMLQSDNADEKNRMADTVNALLRYYVRVDYQSDNWWYNEIFTPESLVEAMLLMGNRLASDIKDAALDIAARGTLIKNKDARDKTGANCLWFAEITVKYGALVGNGSYIQTAVAFMKQELKYSDGEGIGRDGGFYQHSNRLYTGGYGQSFISTTANILYMLSGTEFAVSADSLKPLCTMITEGLRYMTMGKYVDYATVGRCISRNGALDMSALVPDLQRLLSVDNLPERSAIEAYMHSIQNGSTEDLGLKYFDRAKVLVIHNRDFYFSFRGCDDDLYYTEALNGENVLGYNLSYGNTTTIMKTGSEYFNISPVWDFALIPGTSAVYETDEQLLMHTDFNKRTLDGIFGGKQQENQAVLFSKASHEGISSTVACFATDKGAVILGAGIKNSDNLPMITTVDQCYLNGSVLQNGNTVIHNGIRYTILEGDYQTKTAESTGSWSRNRVSSAATAVSAELFTLTISGGDSYAYAVSSENDNAEFRVLENNENVQAVLMPDATICAVFYKTGSFSYNGKTYWGLKGSAIFR